MSEDTKTFQIQSSALTDRGLNERRPLNEDAFLHDRERSIFAVADGVGGAEAVKSRRKLRSKFSTKRFVTRSTAPTLKT